MESAVGYDGTDILFQVTLDDGSVIGTRLPVVPTADETNRDTLTAKATTALTNNATFLAITNPTNAQAVTQVQALTRQMNAVIRILVGQLNTTTGT